MLHDTQHCCDLNVAHICSVFAHRRITCQHVVEEEGARLPCHPLHPGNDVVAVAAAGGGGGGGGSGGSMNGGIIAGRLARQGG